METSELENDPSRLRKLITEIVEKLELITKINDLFSKQNSVSKKVEKTLNENKVVLDSFKDEFPVIKDQIKKLVKKLKEYKEDTSDDEKRVIDQLNEVINLINTKQEENVNQIDNFSSTMVNKINNLTDSIKVIDNKLNNNNNKLIIVEQPKNSNNMKKRKFLKWIISISAIASITVFVIIMLIIQSNKFVKDLEQIDAGIIKKVNNTGLVSKADVKNEIIAQFEKQNKKKDLEGLKESLIKQIDNMSFSYEQEQYEDVIKLGANSSKEEKEKERVRQSTIENEKNRLINNVVIINLIGRYTVIISCIIALVLVLRAFAGSKKKDDIFE